MNNKNFVGGEYSQHCFIQGDFEIVDLDNKNLVVYEFYNEGGEKKLFIENKKNKNNYSPILKKIIKIKHNNTFTYYVINELLGSGTYGMVYSIRRLKSDDKEIEKIEEKDKKKINNKLKPNELKNKQEIYFRYIEQKFNDDKCKQLLEKRKVVKLKEKIDDYDIENSELVLKFNHDEKIGENIYNKIDIIKKEMIDVLNEEKIDEQERNSIIRSIMDVCGMGIKANNTGTYLIPYRDNNNNIMFYNQKLYYSLYLYNGKSLLDSLEIIKRGAIQIQFLIDLFIFMKYFSKRFVHGDIKIGNILVNFDDNNIIKDFHIIDFDGTMRIKNNMKIPKGHESIKIFNIDEIMTTHYSIFNFDNIYDRYDYAGLFDVMIYILSQGQEKLTDILIEVYNPTFEKQIIINDIKQISNQENNQDIKKIIMFIDKYLQNTQNRWKIISLYILNIFFIIANDEVLYQKYKEIHIIIQNIKKNPIYSLCIQMLHMDPNKRPSYDEILNMLNEIKL